VSELAAQHMVHKILGVAPNMAHYL